MKYHIKRLWEFLKGDSWQSWFVSLALIFIVIKFVFFPFLSLVFGSELPLVVVESCSMHHSIGFGEWWEQNGVWYDDKGISKKEFENFSFRNGFTKGDIIFVVGSKNYEIGDVIVFRSSFKYPLIHRVVGTSPLGTKGDNNAGQLKEETSVGQDKIVGKGVFRIPAIGWLKLVFFEGLKPQGQRGLCRQL